MFPICLDAPEVFTFAEDAAERDARLLVAGEYPQKGLTVTEADIDSLIANFSGSVPVKVEHTDSPLDPLGLVQRVWRDGQALMGRVSFPAEMAAFLSKRGAKKLSVGLLKAPDWKLLETSLTLTPHVPGATLLSDGTPPGSASLATLPEAERVGAVEAGLHWDEVVQLRQQVRRQAVDQQVAELKAAGKLTPATEPLARVLLSAEDGQRVTLSDGGQESVSAAFLAFLKAQPAVVSFSELARAKEGATTLSGAGGAAAYEEDPRQFSDEEHEVLRRLGVEPAAVAQTMAADRRQKAVM